MTVLTLSSIAVTTPMGQQVYEEELASRAAATLGPAWEVRRAIVRTLRSPLGGTVRLPARTLDAAGAATRRAAGRFAYRGSDLVHRMDLRLPPAWGPEILTVHDAVSWRFPDEARPPRASVEEARRAVMIVAPSAFSANELQRVLGVEEITVIHNGVSPDFFEAREIPDAELLHRLGLRRPFVVHVGGSTLRKNLAGLAAAWPTVHAQRPDVTLALIGPPDARRDGLFGGLAGVLQLGRVDDDTMRSVVASAAATVVPSLYEGFGLPALESMAASTPVVAANRASLPEVCGDSAILVEPTGPGLADGLLDALAGGTDVASMIQRGRLRATAFTWEASALHHAALWRATV
jgi:glycosyltransferase involved in cell wall biosynthesis